MKRPVRVVVIDSGVQAAHPHINGASGGIGVNSDGDLHDDYVDRLGHGTAVTAVIREKALLAEMFVAKVFDRELAASGVALVAAVSRMRRGGAGVVAAGAPDGVPWLPGTLPGAWRVTIVWSLPRDQCRVVVDGREFSFLASGFPRPIPGVPAEKNLKGLSFAVANVSGLLAALFDRFDMPGSACI